MSADPCDCPLPQEPLCIEADFLMVIPNTQFYFVARLPAIQRPWGPEWSTEVQAAARLRAAATLTQMGLVRGWTLQFLREGLGWTEAQVGTLVGVSAATVSAWEAETLELPLTAWLALADVVVQRDGRYRHVMGPACGDYRARQIRVYPDIPQHNSVYVPNPCPSLC